MSQEEPRDALAAIHLAEQRVAERVAQARAEAAARIAQAQERARTLEAEAQAQARREAAAAYDLAHRQAAAEAEQHLHQAREAIAAFQARAADRQAAVIAAIVARILPPSGGNDARAHGQSAHPGA